MTKIKLTKNQEGFAQDYANGMSQTDAYRKNYSTEKMTDKTVWESASRLHANPKVDARIAEIKKSISDKQLWTREMSVKGLIAAFAVAKQGNNAGAMTGAVKELNNMHGFNEPVKIDHQSRDGSMTPKSAVDVTKLSTDALKEIIAAANKNVDNA